MSTICLIAALSYLLGSLPFGYLLVRIFRGEDVRLSGSGNIGATNVSRRSPALGVVTLLLDALKGAAAVKVAYWLAGRSDGRFSPFGLMAMAALFVILGHVFPVWLKFRGGKGVATALGAFPLIAPHAILAAAGIFVVVVLIFRYVSLGSIAAVTVFPVLVWLMHEYGGSPIAIAFMSFASLLIIAKHHQNLRRLFAGTENRIGSRRS